MSDIFTRRFWRRAAGRAARTFGQTGAALLGASAVDVLSVDWPTLLGVSAGAAAASLFTSLARTSPTDVVRRPRKGPS